MLLYEFEEALRKEYRPENDTHEEKGSGLIALGIFLFFASFTASGFNLAAMIIVSLMLIAAGIYARAAASKLTEPTIIINTLTKEQNEQLIRQVAGLFSPYRIITSPDFIRFTYKRSWWTLNFTTHLIADENLVAIKTISVRRSDMGVDLGASARMEKKVMRFVEKMADRMPGA